MPRKSIPRKPMFWWIVAVLFISLALGGWWLHGVKRPPATTGSAVRPPSQGNVPGRLTSEYVLEVISLGVTLDKYRQGALWEALKQGHPQASIREQNPEKYPWSADEKDGVAGNRHGHTLENGAKFTPMYWGVPVFNAEPPISHSQQVNYFRKRTCTSIRSCRGCGRYRFRAFPRFGVLPPSKYA